MGLILSPDPDPHAVDENRVQGLMPNRPVGVAHPDRDLGIAARRNRTDDVELVVAKASIKPRAARDSESRAQQPCGSLLTVNPRSTVLSSEP